MSGTQLTFFVKLMEILLFLVNFELKEIKLNLDNSNRNPKEL
jgi:hypothetical protein